MICPRCGKEIADSETLCPYCMQEINKNVEFNDFREDGFVQIRTKEDSDTTEPINYTPKYFDIAEFNIFVIAIVYILVVSVFTVFSLRFVQKTHVDVVEVYETQPTTEATPDEEPTTEPIRNDIKNLSIKNIYGSWRLITDEESPERAISYYTFTEDGVAQQNYGSIVSEGSFKDLSTDKEHIIYIKIGTGLRGGYEFDVTGNKDDGYTLTLIDEDNGAAYTFVPAKAQTWTLKPSKDAKIDKNLVGVWYTEDKEKAYKFTRDGRFKRVSGDTKTTGVWSVDRDNVITVKYMKDIVLTRDLDYKVGRGNKRIKVNGVYYYNSKNMPAN